MKDQPALRARVGRRLAKVRPFRDPLARLLAEAEGPVTAELRAWLERPQRDAAVLIALIDRPAGWTMLFTERAEHLAHHPGQISFPGGRIDDGENAIAAALREAWEEVHMPADDVEVAGRLPTHVTGTGFAVTPVVGFVRGTFRPQPSPDEVAGVFEVPLETVLAPGALRTTYRERFGTRFRMYELEHSGRLIWGATAAMLKTFIEVLADESE
jgi:8-oxo-dGTP pyrophosphatase MutT (NUDIX family)